MALEAGALEAVASTPTLEAEVSIPTSARWGMPIRVRSMEDVRSTVLATSMGVAVTPTGTVAPIGAADTGAVIGITAGMGTRHSIMGMATTTAADAVGYIAEPW